MDADETVIQSGGWQSILQQHLRAQVPPPPYYPDHETQLLPKLVARNYAPRILRYYASQGRILEVRGAAVRAIHPSGVEVSDSATHHIFLLPWHRVHELELTPGDDFLKGNNKA